MSYTLRKTATRNTRLKPVQNGRLREVAQLLAALGLPSDSSTVVRFTRSAGRVRSVQVIRPTHNGDPGVCNQFTDLLDRMELPDYGTSSLEFSLNDRGEVVKIKRLSQEETLDLTTI